jgi:P22 coat protein - gene protein 5
MSNTLTNVKDIKVAQKALVPFMANLLPVSAFSTNFGPQPSDKGDTVRVPLIGAPTGSSDFSGDYTSNADSTVTTVPVTLNKHKFKTVHVTAREASETAMDLLDTLVATAAQQLAQDVLLDIMSVINLANFGAPIPAVAATNFDYKKVLNIREECGKLKMPASPRSLVLDAGHYTNLLADDVVAKSFNLNLSAPGVTDALIKRLAGFNLFETVVIPSDHAEKLVGFATHPSAIAVAMRYLQPVAEYQQSGAVTDPQTGMTFGYLRFTDTRANKVFVTIECLYGYTVGKADALKRVVKP